jgi:hypothetical protein
MSLSVASRVRIGHARTVTRRTVPATTTDAASVDALVTALTELRDELADIRFPLTVPSAGPASTEAGRILRQLDDYLLPRLSRPDAPLLVVVGGSTGAGKSTLVNSVVRAPVSPSGVLRPTTMAPVLVSHPADTAWYAEGQLLPELPRTTGLTSEPGSLRIIAAPGMIPGLALLDAPDFDSVVAANRRTAEQLLAAADLWLFVTTAARYADAVPWEVLRTAGARGTALAIVLDRVPPGAEQAIGHHLDELLERNGLAGTRRFVVPETKVDGQGLLAERLVDPLCDWLAQLATDAGKRSTVVRQTVFGAVTALAPALRDLALAADEQVAAAGALDEGVRAAWTTALTSVERGSGDGTVLRGEALTRWQDFVGSGQLVHALQAHLGRLRDRVGAALTGRQAPGGQLRDALAAGLVTVITSAAADAEDQVRAVWATQPGLLAAVPAAPDARADAQRAVRLWQGRLPDLVRGEPADGRRGLPRTQVEATTLLVTIAVCASRTYAPTAAELAVTGGLHGGDQALLDRVFADEKLRDLAQRARAELGRFVRDLFDARLGRYLVTLDTAAVPAELPDRLRAVAGATRAALETAGPGGAPPSDSDAGTGGGRPGGGAAGTARIRGVRAGGAGEAA